MHPIADKAEIAVDFPEKCYMGEFGRNSDFDAGIEADGIRIRLRRTAGEKRAVEVHLHYLLFADILDEVSLALTAGAPIDRPHGERLLDAVRVLATALENAAGAAPIG